MSCKLIELKFSNLCFLLYLIENFSCSPWTRSWNNRSCVPCIRVLKKINFWIKYLEYKEGKVTENGAEENTNHTHNGWKEPTGKWKF